jgi:hypothetical protein
LLAGAALTSPAIADDGDTYETHHPTLPEQRQTFATLVQEKIGTPEQLETLDTSLQELRALLARIRETMRSENQQESAD